MSEPAVDHLLTVPQAIAMIDAVKVATPTEQISLTEAAGRVLAQDLLADRDYPPFDKSQMDGYAVRGSDAGNGETLTVVGEVAAGRVADTTVAAGQAVAIMTGAPLPAGADAVVPVEDVQEQGGKIVVRRAAVGGRYIARRGSDCAAGTAVLPAGTRLGPAQIAVAASIGAANVVVYAKPVVGLLTTGDEIVPIAAPPGPSQIRDSNNPMLAALLRRLGCTVYDFGHVGDDRGQIREKIAKAAGCQALFITGGMSMGRYDHVPPILREMNFDLRVTKVRIKPGKPFVFAVGDARSPFVFGLPGNPVSAFVCTLRLASRLLSRLAGEVVRERWLDAELESPLPANGPREFYQPAVLVRSQGRTIARPLQWKGSADVFTLARADALLVRPADDPARDVGSRVQLLEVPR